MFRTIWTTIFGDTMKTGIRVKFLDYISNSLLEEVEFPQEYLPEDFATPQSVFIGDKEWLIVKAEPLHANQYTFDKKLTLWIKDSTEALLQKITEHPAASRIKIKGSTPGSYL